MSVHDKLDALEKVLQEALQQIDEIRASAKDKYPDWVNWEAIDMDGDHWHYEKEPKIDVCEGYFRSAGGYSEYIGTRSTTDWTKSLKRIER